MGCIVSLLCSGPDFRFFMFGNGNSINITNRQESNHGQ